MSVSEQPPDPAGDEVPEWEPEMRACDGEHDVFIYSTEEADAWIEWTGPVIPRGDWL